LIDVISWSRLSARQLRLPPTLVLKVPTKHTGDMIDGKKVISARREFLIKLCSTPQKPSAPLGRSEAV
jgi:hypothetical protein